MLAVVTGVFLRARASSPRSGASSLWDVLHELARARARVGLERERRATLVVMLEHLPNRGLRVEDTAQGRRTVIAGETGESLPRP